MNCTVATENVARAFGFASRDGDAVMAGTQPGAAGLGMLPFFNGERTPDLPLARASFYGMDFDNFTRANAYRAAMEGATFALRSGFDALLNTGLGCNAIRLTGGGSQSAAWRQMVADVLGKAVEVPEQAEGAAFGAALQALWATQTAGRPADLLDLTREHVKVVSNLGAVPDGEAAASYREAYGQFLRHLRAAKSLYSSRPGGG
jgi:xylulokinase